jgi:phosphoserine phosphatase
VAAVALCVAAPLAARASDPLPSWSDGTPKRAIVAFVERVTAADGRDFVPAADRIAVFDNDGTLWPEQPVVQAAFLAARLKALAEKDGSMRSLQPFKAALEGDVAWLREAGEGALMQLVAAAHGEMTQEEFEAEARAFFRTARHPKLGAAYAALAYQPMLELLQFLRANGFQTWICSGGGADFIRVVSEQMYGIPPQQVIGSTLKEEWVRRDGRAVLWRGAEVARVNDKAGKPVGIDLHIGKRPVFAAGNVRSGGDVAMLEYAQGRPGASFELVIDHDDAEREFAYQEMDGATMAAAKANGWTVVSMKRDWKAVFPARAGPAFSVEYVQPKDPSFRRYFDGLRERKVLEELAGTLSFIRLPTPLTLRAKQCGESNAMYDSDDHSVNFCYELVDELVRDAPGAATQGLAVRDAVVGPFVFIFLHEIGHAIFDLLHVPIFGHEEDAADQFAAYALLRAGPEFAKRILAGAAWMYAHGAAGRKPDESDFSDVHALDSQRYYNVLCLAYGSDPKEYAAAAGEHRLPADRAEGCADEFKQVQVAVQQLIAPHADVRELQRIKAERAARRGSNPR